MAKTNSKKRKDVVPPKETVEELKSATGKKIPTKATYLPKGLISDKALSDLAKLAGQVKIPWPSTSATIRSLSSMSSIPSTINIPSRNYYIGTIDPRRATHSIKLGRDLEEDIINLRRKNRQLIDRIEEKAKAEAEQGKEIEELQKKLQEQEKATKDKERLQHIFYRVHPLAWQKLKTDEEFKALFEQKAPCPAVIVSIDIRRSTELMLNAIDPESYQNFIITLCDQLRQIILDNYGVFDKFTGDGILSFFPEFYSGEDAHYLAIKSADECHAFFKQHYEANRSAFKIVLKDVGLGIGIDYGKVYLVNVQDWLTVIGEPVVYACRLSGGKAEQTLVNQQAYDTFLQNLGGYVHIQEEEITIKHVGPVVCYSAGLSKRERKINIPPWMEETESITS